MDGIQFERDGRYNVINVEDMYSAANVVVQFSRTGFTKVSAVRRTAWT